MNQARQDTWRNFLQEVAHHHVVADPDLSEKVGEIFSLNENFIKAFNYCAPMIYLLDYASGRYITMSKSVKSILGFHAEAFSEGGLGFTIDRYHKEQLRNFEQEIFPDRFEIIKKIPATELANYVFSYSLSLKGRDGKYRTLLQRNIHVKSDEKGNPLLSLGIAVDASGFRTPETPVKQLVEKKSGDGTSETIFEREYPVRPEDAIFSKREVEVLLWMAEGMASKQIADKLNLSEATVNVHRKNMLRKAGATNVAALIAFAFRKKIL